MGYICHSMIVVTGFREEDVKAAHSRALAIFGRALPEEDATSIAGVTSIAEAGVNGYWSFLVGPDGSKEGWGHSSAGDGARAAFIDWMRLSKDDLFLTWAEVEMPEDGPPCVTAHA